MEMEMGQLMDELRSAIQKSIAESDEIAAIVGDMARAGFDLVLVLETTLGVSKTDQPAEDIEWWKTQMEAPVPIPVAVDCSGAVAFTDEDEKFLQSLNIAA
jgi:hypothetical protein